LLAEYHKYVRVYEIVYSHLPGYVYLELRYLLTVCVEGSKYNVVEYYGQNYLSNRSYVLDASNIHGPAVLTAYLGSSFTSDMVHCIRCLVWPVQAADWPIRRRNYGWPESATVDHVVSNGCDVVGVAHRHCKQHEWMNMYQWRLSFSRAEIVLINSWMPVQQIVYHMLRVFMKTERLTDTANNTVACSLSNYHIKTLMLWACELKSRSWWTDDLSLVRICVQLLHILGDWLTDARCRHYFIGNCNLVDTDKPCDSETIARLLLINNASLSTWFVNVYIRKSARLCPQDVSRLFDDVSTMIKLENAVSAVADWRQKATLRDEWQLLQLGQYVIAYFARYFSSAARILRVSGMTALAKADARLTVYFTGVVFLDVARKIVSGGLNENLLNLLSSAVQFVASYYNNERTFSFVSDVVAMACQQSATNTTDSNTSELVELLQQSAVEHLTIFRQIQARDIGSVATIVTTDFKALYAYKRGDYLLCLQLSAENVHTLLYAERITDVLTFPEFIQLLDDDITSLTALTLISKPASMCRYNLSLLVCITQLTLSLYLMTQCQLKLHHSLTSVTQTLDYIAFAKARCPVCRTLDHLTLKLMTRKIATYTTRRLIAYKRLVTTTTDYIR